MRTVHALALWFAGVSVLVWWPHPIAMLTSFVALCVGFGLFLAAAILVTNRLYWGRWL
jgi:hypothetical protein